MSDKMNNNAHINPALGPVKGFARKTSGIADTLPIREFVFLLLVIIPSVLSLLYYSLIASDIYVSEAKISVTVNEGLPAGVGGSSQLLAPIIGSSSNMNKSFIVKEFIHSNEILKKLDEKIGLKKLYNSENADFVARLGNEPSQEDYLKYFKKMVEIRLDEHSNIMYVKSRAFASKDSQVILEAVIGLSEEFVNNMSSRMKQDVVSFSEQELKNSEDNLVSQNKVITQFRNKNKNYDPTVSTRTVIEIIAKLQAELSAVETEVAALQNYMRPESPKLQMLNSKADALKKQINDQNSLLTNQKKSNLADITQGYSTLDLESQFALKRYEITAASLQSAQIEARKNSVYLLRIDNPSLPESAVEPERIKKIILNFLVLMIAYAVIRIIISSILDHIKQ